MVVVLKTPKKKGILLENSWRRFVVYTRRGSATSARCLYRREIIVAKTTRRFQETNRRFRTPPGPPTPREEEKEEKECGDNKINNRELELRI